MWSTLTAGLQLVQQKLDHVIEDVAGQHAGTDVAQTGIRPMVDTADGSTSEKLNDEAPSLTQASSTSEMQQSPPRRTVQPVSVGGQEGTEEEVQSLREALRSSEDQVQLIHSEYRNICREKDDTIRSLRAALEQGGGHHQEVLAVEKELAVYKDMVVELRKQLEEKESDLQELNSKAEAKFNKLKNQAKGKISALTKELEQLKGGKGDTQQNTSQVLEDSFGPGGMADPSTQQHLEDVIAQLSQCKQVIVSLESEKQQLLLNGTEQSAKLQAAADELAKAQVLLDREQGARLSLVQELATLEGQLELCREELNGAKATHEQDLQLLEHEREQYRSLHARMVDPGFQLERHHSLQRDHSSASSDVQVVSAAPSQLDSEEEWKLVPSGSGNSSGGKSGPYSPLEIAEMPTAEQRVVLSSGDKASLVDLESELARLEALLHEREDELSSIRGVLERKDSYLRHSEEQASQLSELCSAKGVEVDKLKVELDEARSTISGLQGRIVGVEGERSEDLSSNEGLIEHCHKLEGELSSLRDIVRGSESAREQLEQQLQDKVMAMSELLRKVEEVRGSASEAQQEVGRLTRLLDEAKLTNQVLQESLDRDTRGCAEKLGVSAKQIEELGLINTHLQAKIDEKESHIQELLQAKVSLEQVLLCTKENLQNSEEKVTSAALSLQQELEDMKVESERREKEAREGAEALRVELQETLRKHKLVEQQLQEVSGSEAKKEEEVTLLRGNVKELVLENTKLREDIGQLSAALQSARDQHAHCDTVALKVKELSSTLEAMQQRALGAEDELAVMNAEYAQRSDELIQKNEVLSRERAELNEKLMAVSLQAEQQKKELEATVLRLQQQEAEKVSLAKDLESLQLRLEAMHREQESGRTQAELLQGKVDEVSRAKEVAVKEQAKHKEEVTKLQKSVANLTDQVTDLQQKLKSSEQRLSRAAEENGAEKAMREGMAAELSRLERENKQMKSQFDSAVQLMEGRVAEQASALTKVQQDKAARDAECMSLREQLGSESRQSGQLKEKVAKLTTDCQVWSDRCRLLQQDQVDLRRLLAEKSSEAELLRQTASNVQADQDKFSVERDLLLSNMQEQESRTLVVMDQVAAISRDKELLEAQVRELGRKLGSSEEQRKQLCVQLQEWEGLVSNTEKQQMELKYLTEVKASLEHDKTQLLALQVGLEGKVDELEATVTQLQQQLSQVQSEADLRRKDAGKLALVEELQRKLSEVEQTHSQHIIKLQHSLREEVDGRQSAERALAELRGEVSIGMEDETHVVQTQGMRDSSAAVYLQIVAAQFQRFIKNPNIVLTRLLRATPQTKLLFILYFVVLHLFLLYFIVV